MVRTDKQAMYSEETDNVGLGVLVRGGARGCGACIHSETDLELLNPEFVKRLRVTNPDE